ncbi:MAG: hypothetical protein ACP5HM_05250 [Anaerolineae bacterium]
MGSATRPPAIFLPEEVRPLYLVTLSPELPHPYAKAREVFARYRERSYRVLLDQAALLFKDAWGARERHVAALAQLYQADLYQRLDREREALQAARMSAKWLALQVPVRARYEEAVARYFSGVLWYLNAKPERAMRSLNAALNLLNEAQRVWRYNGGHPQLVHCERLQRWVSDLLALRLEAWEHPEITILPVYSRRDDDRVELEGATAVDRRALLPSEDADLRPLVGSTEDQTLASELYYFAVKVETDSHAPPPTSPVTPVDGGNLVYIEAEPVGAAAHDDRPSFKFITGEMQGRRVIGNEDM